MNDLINEKTMTIKEIAEIMNYDESTIRKVGKALFPDIIQNGKITYLNQMQITAIKLQLGKKSELVKTDMQMSLQLIESAKYFELKYNEVKKQNEIMTPKAIAFDTFIDSSGLKSINEIGKLLKIGRNKLFEILRKKNILMKNNLPYQKYMDLNYFEVKNTSNNQINFNTTYVTPDGLCFIERKLNEI